MEWIQTHWVDITAIIGGVVTIASIVAKLTPSKSDDVVVDKIISVINALALNPKR